MTPTYGNTLMGLACSKPVTAAENYKISYYAPQPRAVIEIVDFNDSDRVVGYGETGRVKLTTLTKEFFVPGFLERDEGERETAVCQVSLGRRQRRAPVPRAGRGHDRGRVLVWHWRVASVRLSTEHWQDASATLAAAICPARRQHRPRATDH